MSTRDFKALRDKYIKSKIKRSQFYHFHREMITAGGLDVGKDDWKGIEIGCGITPMKDNFPNIIALWICKIFRLLLFGYLSPLVCWIEI